MRDDRGSVTAEFAVALPAVVLLLGVFLAALNLGSLAVRAQDAAGLAARSLARGVTTAAAQSAAHTLLPGARLQRADRSGLVCVVVTARGPAVLSGIEVQAESCALADR